MPVSTRTSGPREVALSSDATAALAAARRDHPRVEDVLKGWKWRLARQPECGQGLPPDFIDDGDVRPIRMVRSGNLVGGLPSIMLIYRYDETRVDILRLKVFPPGRDPTF